MPRSDITFTTTIAGTNHFSLSTLVKMASKIRAIFPAPIISIAFLLLASLSLAQSQGNEMVSCRDVTLNNSFDVAKMAGDWYEIARSPAAEMPACVHIIAPASGVDGNYRLQVEYVTSFGSKFKRIKETVIFPWAEAKVGRFILKTGETWQLIMGDYETIFGLCGYGKDPKAQDFFKMIMRDLDDVRKLEEVFKKHPNAGRVEQSSKCDGAAALIPTLMGLLTSVLVLAVRS